MNLDITSFCLDPLKFVSLRFDCIYNKIVSSRKRQCPNLFKQVALKCTFDPVEIYLDLKARMNINNSNKSTGGERKENTAYISYQAVQVCIRPTIRKCGQSSQLANVMGLLDFQTCVGHMASCYQFKCNKKNDIKRLI